MLRLLGQRSMHCVACHVQGRQPEALSPLLLLGSHATSPDPCRTAGTGPVQAGARDRQGRSGGHAVPHTLTWNTKLDFFSLASIFLSGLLSQAIRHWFSSEATSGCSCNIVHGHDGLSLNACGIWRCVCSCSAVHGRYGQHGFQGHA